MTTKRIEYIDEIRGLAIILVVVGHLIQFNGVSTNNPVFEFIYSFHMPLFFAISGYITQKVTQITSFKQYILFVKKKIIALIIPLLAWSLLVTPFFLAEQWNAIGWNEVRQVIVSPGLWFLKMLFVILLFYGIFNWISHTTTKNVFVNFIFSITPPVLISLFVVYIGIMEANLIMFSYAFYLGVILSKYNKIEQFCMTDEVYGLTATVFLVLSTHWVFGGNFIDDIYKITVSTAAFIFFLNLFTKLNINSNAKQALQLFGRYSLAIYVIQFYLCGIYKGYTLIQIENINSIILFVITLAIAIPICYICVLIAKIIETNKLCNFFLLGKRINKK